jgi:hypothetical protein
MSGANSDNWLSRRRAQEATEELKVVGQKAKKPRAQPKEQARRAADFVGGRAYAA